MKRAELVFPRPQALQATAPAEERGLNRDEVRLMVSTPSGHRHGHFLDLPEMLLPGDLLVINESATIPASLPARSSAGAHVISLSTEYGDGVWLVEPRWSTALPGPLPLRSGEVIEVAGVACRLIAPFPGLPRLWYIHADGDLKAAMACVGKPIRYGYVNEAYPLADYETIFARVPGSAEMPSAAYPFTQRVVDGLEARGVEIARLLLHTGVSSLEVDVDEVEEHPLYAEPFAISDATAHAVNAAIAANRRIIAVGTTAVRALESTWDGRQVRAAQGFTHVYITPKRGVHVVDGLITGLHDPITSHLAMLYAIAGQALVRSAYAEAVERGYLWHEFGDSHLILSASAVAKAQRSGISTAA